MISQQQIAEIGQFVAEQNLSGSLPELLRQQFNGIHFTFCMDDDVVAASPVLEQDSFNLYLIDSSNHCLTFTQDLELATGVVVAEVEIE